MCALTSSFAHQHLFGRPLPLYIGRWTSFMHIEKLKHAAIKPPDIRTQNIPIMNTVQYMYVEETIAVQVNETHCTVLYYIIDNNVRYIIRYSKLRQV